MAKRKSADTALQAFMFAARQQFLTADEAESENRKEGLTDVKFLNLEQWPAEIKAAREVVGQERPCLTIDQIGEPYRQLTNKVREARSAIRIVPEDGDANKKTAEKLQEMVRGIEYASDAHGAYVTAFEGAAGPGWGYVRLRTEYEDATKGRDQCIRIEAIENQFAVWIDPAAKEPDRRDMRFAFVAESMPLETYKEKYGESMAATQSSRELFTGIGANWQDWFPEGRVVVAEYYYRDDTSTVMVELEDGTVMPKSDVPKGRDDAGRFVAAPKIVHEWDAETPVVKWCKINGVEILEGDEKKESGRRIPGTTIPIRPCYGQLLNVNGKRVIRGMVRAARDPQQMYNYNNSALVEDLALVPKTKVFMAEGQEEGHEGEWNQALSAPTPYIRYKPTALGDKLVPPPSVSQFTDPAKIQSLVIAIQQNKADLRSTLSYYDQTDPSRKNTDQSGKAQLVRKQENDEGKTGYLDNYSKFQTSVGKLLVEWIVEVYDRPGRVVRGMDLEDNPGFMMLNKPYRMNQEDYPEAVGDDAMALGKPDDYDHIDLSKGKYGVRVTVGKSYTTQKQEAAENGLRLMEVLPQQAPMFADLVVTNVDGPGSEQIAERLKRMVPPQIRGDDEKDQNNPEALKAQLSQAQQKMQEMTQVIQGLQNEIKTDEPKLKVDLQKAQMSAQVDSQKAQQSDGVKLQIAQMDNETKLEIEERRFRHELQLEQMKLQAQIEQAHIGAQQAAQEQQGQQRHEAGMAGAQAGQAARSQREGFAHEDAGAERDHSHAMEAGEQGIAGQLAVQAAQPQPEPML